MPDKKPPRISIQTDISLLSDDKHPQSSTSSNDANRLNTDQNINSALNSHYAESTSILTSSPTSYSALSTSPSPLLSPLDSSKPLLSSSSSSSTSLSSKGAASNSSDASSTFLSPQQLMALNPDEDLALQSSPFAFHPKQLRHLFDPKNIQLLSFLGGIPGLVKGLRTNTHSGLSSSETILDGHVSIKDCVSDPSSLQTSQQSNQSNNSHSIGDHDSNHSKFVSREALYSKNVLPERKSKSLLQLMGVAMQDPTLILLAVVAVISLSLGLYQTFGTEPEYDDHGNPLPKVEWVDGVAIVVAISIVVCVGALNDYQKERQFQKLNRQKSDREVQVIRDGDEVLISIYDLQAGDIYCLSPGEVAPADGVLIYCQNLKCDESSATGESDAVRKITAAESLQLYNSQPISSRSPYATKQNDPFIISGSKVIQGVGKYLVTSVGVNSLYGRIMMSLRDEPELTPLQAKLVIIAETIAKWGSASSILLFFVLFIRFLVNLPGNHEPPSQKGQDFIQILVTSITLIVVAVPEGLPLAVTLALAFATIRMLRDKNLVRRLAACETMGNATTVCSDKTGTLTQNKMTVVSGTLGLDFEFSKRPGSAGRESLDVGSTVSSDDNRGSLDIPNSNEIIPINVFVSEISPSVKQLLLDSIVANSTAFEDKHNPGEFVGSKTETALIGFAKLYFGLESLSTARSNFNVIQLIPFDSAVKYMGVVIELPNNKGYRLFLKGASEIVLDKCTEIISKTKSSLGDELASTPLTSEKKLAISDKILNYASNSLRTIVLAYRDFPPGSWPPKGVPPLGTSIEDAKLAEVSSLISSCTEICLVGIQDPLRPAVISAVKDCAKAGVTVRMVTGDNLNTAQAIAMQAGIYHPKVHPNTENGAASNNLGDEDSDSDDEEDEIVLEGPAFRNLSKVEMERILPRLRVLARSSPDDKRILVTALRKMGEVVAVTGDGSNDAMALKRADVGFSMGIAGTEVAKEASDIILMDDNFASIVKALLWGRAVNDAVKKFLQFQLTVNITAVVLTFVSAVGSSKGRSVLTAVQLLWVNLIMDTFAALALATDPPSRSLLDRKPEPRGHNMISTTMWKMIILEAIYQLAVTFTLHFAGQNFFDMEDGYEDEQLNALVFNVFVWMQVFNMLNNRRLDNRYNIFEGVTHNLFFIGISAFICGAQVLIMFVGGAPFSIYRQTPAMWGTAILLGLGSIFVGLIVRTIPDSWIPVPLIVKVYNATLGRVAAQMGKTYDATLGKFFVWLYHLIVDGTKKGAIRITDSNRFKRSSHGEVDFESDSDLDSYDDESDYDGSINTKSRHRNLKGKGKAENESLLSPSNWRWNNSRRRLEDDSVSNADDSSSTHLQLPTAAVHRQGRRSPSISGISEAEASGITGKNEYIWNPALEHVRDELLLIRALRGHRLSGLNLYSRRNSKLPQKRIRRHRKYSNTSILGGNSPEGSSQPANRTGIKLKGNNSNKSNERTGGNSISAMVVPGIVAGSVAGWSPTTVSNPKLPSTASSPNSRK